MPDRHAPTTDSSLVALLLAEGPLTRIDLQRKLEVSRPTLSASVNRLLDAGALVELGTAVYGQGRNGRPQALLAPNRAAGSAVGIELGRAQVTVTIVAVDGTVTAQKSTETRGGVCLQEKVEVAVRLIRRLLDAGSFDRHKVVGIGLGVTGRHPTGNGAPSPADPGDVDLSPFRLLLPAPITWDNNTRMAALRYTARTSQASPRSDVLFVVLSSGVSAAVLKDGGLFRGAGAAGELGHICIDPRGPRCTCGTHGCLEAYVGTDAVLDKARSRGLTVDGIEGLRARVESGDQDALLLVNDVGVSLGMGLGTASMLLDPGVIVISGPLASLGHPLVASAERELRARRGAVGLPCPPIEIAGPGAQDSSHGAAEQVLQLWGVPYLAKDLLQATG